MRKLGVIVLMAAMLFCTACSRSATHQKELTRVVFHRGHGSTWGSQFLMDICPGEVSSLQYFTDQEDGREFRDLTALPIEKEQWEQVETAVLQLLPQLQVKKDPGPLKRLLQALGPQTVDGGEWRTLTMTWVVDGELQKVNYEWPSSEEAEACELLLEELAKTLDQ